MYITKKQKKKKKKKIATACKIKNIHYVRCRKKYSFTKHERKQSFSVNCDDGNVL